MSLGDGRPRRALMVAADIPDPPRGGNHLRYLQNIALLRSLGFDVTLVAGAVRGDAATAGAGPDAVLRAYTPVPPLGVSPGDRLRRLVAMGRGSLRRSPIDPWGLAHTQAGFDDLVLESAGAVAPDVVVVRSLFAHLIPALRAPGRVVVVDAHDVGSMQARAMLAATTGARRIGLHARRIGARRAERALTDADEVWAASPAELSHFTALGARAVLVRNGIPVPAALPRHAPGATELLLMGGFGYPPNLAAARTLVEDILPIVRRHRPEVSATLIGRDLPEALRRSWSSDGVRYLGVVEDVAPHLAAAAALVFVPDWSTGTPLKVAEALANGVPLVCNTLAVQGFALVHGVHALVGASPADHARHVLELLDDSTRRDQIRVAAHAWARAHLSREAVEAEVRRSSVIMPRD